MWTYKLGPDHLLNLDAYLITFVYFPRVSFSLVYHMLRYAIHSLLILLSY
jgi:hypothetical protein